MTNRRGFLGMLGAAIAGATLDPERLLWVPGAKLISIPALSAFPAKYHLSFDEFTRQYLQSAVDQINKEFERDLAFWWRIRSVIIS